jgi:hypothetical protein
MLYNFFPDRPYVLITYNSAIQEIQDGRNFYCFLLILRAENTKLYTKLRDLITFVVKQLDQNPIIGKNPEWTVSGN